MVLYLFSSLDFGTESFFYFKNDWGYKSRQILL